MKKCFVTIYAILFLCILISPGMAKVPDLIPQPQEAKWGKEIGLVAGKKVSIIPSAVEKESYTTSAAKDFLTKANAIVTIGDTKESDILIYLGRLEDGSDFRDTPHFKKLVKELNPRAPGEGYYFKIANRDGKIIIEIAGTEDPGTFYGTQTLKQIIFTEIEKTGPLYEVEIYDWPKFVFRGVIEGHGGRWTHEQRMRFYEFMGEHKLNYYLYVPKGDNKVRREWRKPYTDEEMADFKKEVEFVRKNKISFAYAINPALSAHCGSDKTFNTIIEKFERFRAIGVEQFGLLFDDILPLRQSKQDREMFGSAAEAHSYLANRLYRYLKEKNPRTIFFFCPTPYWSIDNYGYFQVLKEKLDPEIAVGWTGKGVVPYSIPLENAKKFHEITGHQIGLGDNYPVHGGGMCMGTLRQRDPHLFEYIPAFVANPSWSRPTETSIPLATIADYTWNPLNYDADRAWEVRIRRFAGSNNYPYLRTFSEMYKEGWPKFDKPDPLAVKREKLNDAWKKGENIDASLKAVEDEYKWIKTATIFMRDEFPDRILIEEIATGNYFEKLIKHVEEGLVKCKAVRDAIASGAKDAVDKAMEELMKFKFEH